jgi:hypothetical protein
LKSNKFDIFLVFDSVALKCTSIDSLASQLSIGDHLIHLSFQIQPLEGRNGHDPWRLSRQFVKEIRYLFSFSFGSFESHSDRHLNISAIGLWYFHSFIADWLAARGPKLGTNSKWRHLFIGVNKFICKKNDFEEKRNEMIERVDRQHQVDEEGVFP